MTIMPFRALFFLTLRYSDQQYSAIEDALRRLGALVRMPTCCVSIVSTACRSCSQCIVGLDDSSACVRCFKHIVIGIRSAGCVVPGASGTSND